MSILAVEYDVEIAKRVYGEELMEDVAVKMLKMGLSKEQVSQATGLRLEEVLEIEASL